MACSLPATGEIRSVSGTTTGDHEVALEVTCRSIDSATLASRDLQAVVPASLFGPCAAKRRATDALVVFPVIRAAHGAVRFPFCSSDAASCTSGDGTRLRARSALSITPAPTGWGRTDEIEPAEFAVLPPLGATTTVSLSAPLAGGATATTSIEIPPVP